MKNNVTRKIPITKSILSEKMDNIRGAVMMGEFILSIDVLN